MERIVRDDSIGLSVRAMDLRDVKRSAVDARRRLRGERSSALSAMGSSGARPPQPPSAAAAVWRPAGSLAAGVAPAHAAPPARPSPPHQPLALQALYDLPTPPLPQPSPAGRLAAATASAAVMEVAQLHARASALEECLRSTVAAFAQHVQQCEPLNSRSDFYAVTFPAGAIGMILTAADSGAIEVAELRDDAQGRPLLARASGRIAVGDAVIAINSHALARFGAPSLEGVAAEFKAAHRPVTVLFQRRR